MTTQSWSSRVRHDSDATFREWGSELATKMAAAGLVQTADTGQINWVTVTRPGSSTDAGYEIWRMNDTQQATAPVFFKFFYGTHGSATGPRIRVQTGTGSNGSGTLTGLLSTATNNIHASSAQASDTGRQSYMCCVDGFFGMNWKVGANASEASFFFARSVGSTGVATATAAIVIWGSGGSSVVTATQVFRYAATAEAYSEVTSVGDTALGINPQSRLNTLVGADIQAAIGWIPTPRIAPIAGLCGVLPSEVSTGTTFSFIPVGSTSRTFIGLNTSAGPFGPINASGAGGLKFAMLWE